MGKVILDRGRSIEGQTLHDAGALLIGMPDFKVSLEAEGVKSSCRTADVL